METFVSRHTIIDKNAIGDFKITTIYSMAGVSVCVTTGFSLYPKTVDGIKECIAIHDMHLSKRWDEKSKAIDDVILTAFVKSGLGAAG